MTDETHKDAAKEPPVKDPILLETMRRCWRKWRDARIDLEKQGMKLCPACRSVPIEMKRKMCAVCENRRSGRGVTQGNPTSQEKR